MFEFTVLETAADAALVLDTAGIRVEPATAAEETRAMASPFGAGGTSDDRDLIELSEPGPSPAVDEAAAEEAVAAVRHVEYHELFSQLRRRD
jgi:hypothetical protein